MPPTTFLAIIPAPPFVFGPPEIGMFLLANVVILFIVGPKLYREFFKAK